MVRDRKHIENWFKTLQDQICEKLEEIDGSGHFKEDLWERSAGGGGRTRVLTGGAIIEKGGVNFSAVHGPTPDKIREAFQIESGDFFASGVSIVLHPENPWMPIIHMNVRYFELSNGTYWFGGGIDLTPHYVTKQDGQFIHQQLKTVCDQTHPEFYLRYKKRADDYFYIKHRQETRGVGGIFFDQLKEGQDGLSFEEIWTFVQNVGRSFIPIYAHYVQQNAEKTWAPAHKKWQMMRRGRYVEFNLVWDLGTKFGLDTDGRTESILMSMPPECNWQYDYQPVVDSPEAETLRWLKKDIDWLA